MEEFYVPRVLACILPAKRTINDVLSSPDEYSYPAVFIHCAAALGGASVDKSQVEEAVRSKKVVKNKEYDIPLLTGLL
ncbi:hypothetical protein D3C73_1610100 [compost metagenome]